ncbi:hypothetical protein CPB85DRAFT_1446166 [Mucidula mucida]|nr:hypothetical protein CPB85DRAFT_1446166 [Mucidula mucida]
MATHGFLPPTIIVFADIYRLFSHSGRLQWDITVQDDALFDVDLPILGSHEPFYSDTPASHHTLDKPTDCNLGIVTDVARVLRASRLWYVYRLFVDEFSDGTASQPCLDYALLDSDTTGLLFFDVQSGTMTCYTERLLDAVQGSVSSTTDKHALGNITTLLLTLSSRHAAIPFGFVPVGGI